MGADSIKQLLNIVDLAEIQKELEEAMGTTRSKQIRKKLAKRLKLVQGFANSHTRPEWMILDVLPVIPPDLRPLVPLEGGRFATSDLNLSLIHISEPTRLLSISYAVFCLKKK